MKRLISLVVPAVLLSAVVVPSALEAPAHAAEDAPITPTSVVAETVRAHRGMRSFAVDFTYSQIDNLQAEVEQGSAYFRGGRFRISYEEIDWYSNGRYVWRHHHPVNRVFIFDADPNLYWDLDRVLWYDWSTAEATELVPESESWHVTVVVNDPTVDLFRAELWVSMDTKLIDRAILYDRAGVRHSYDLGEYDRRRTPLNIYTFSVRKNPDTELLPFTAEPYFEAEIQE
ncbi:hypothetical protein L6R49_15195 [Myxococcota bacterium]|nr:hypothetical protein [Myxococcota bacterium]